MAKKLRILLATGLYPPSVGGPATYSKLLHDELPKRGIAVDVVSFDSVRSYPKGIRHLLYLFCLMSKVSKATHVYAQDPVSVGLPAWCVARMCGKVFGIRVAGDYAWEQSVQRYGVTDDIDAFQHNTYDFRTELLRKLQRFSVSRADFIVTPSEYFKMLVGAWAPNKEHVHRIYNGIELPQKLPQKKEARFTLEIPEDKEVVVSAGRLVPWKGFRGLIDVIARLHADRPRIALYILGDGPEKKELIAYAEKKGVSERVHVVGRADRMGMFAYLRAADVFALNTSFESFSFQIVEALHAGVPTVTTRIGSLPELIEHKRDGVLVEPDNLDAIEDAIDTMLSGGEEVERYKQRAHEKAKQFSIKKTLDEIVVLFQKYERS